VTLFFICPPYLLRLNAGHVIPVELKAAGTLQHTSVILLGGPAVPGTRSVLCGETVQNRMLPDGGI
jgi:hypothetical protein